MRDVWPRRAIAAGSAVTRDADRLQRQHGGQAYDTAGIYSWREEIGLLYVANPGHWQRVRLEIARRVGHGREGSARIGALHLM